MYNYIKIYLKIILKVTENGFKTFNTIFYNFLFFLKKIIKRIKINLNLKIILKVIKNGFETFKTIFYNFLFFLKKRIKYLKLI